MTKNLLTVAALALSLAVPAAVTFAADPAESTPPATAKKVKKTMKKKAAAAQAAPAAEAPKK